MLQLCRTCLAEIRDTTYVMLNTKGVKAESIQAQLAACVPELQLNLVEDPVICRNCVTILELAYTFKIRCLLTEKRIQSCIRRTKLNGKRVTLAKLFNFSNQSDTESCCSVVKESEGRNLGARNHNTTRVEQFFAEPATLNQDIQNVDNVLEGRTNNYINPAPKKDSNVVKTNDVSIVDAEGKIELRSVVTNSEIAVDSPTHNLECQEKVLESSVLAINNVDTHETSQDSNEDVIVKEENEIFTVKTEKDKVLSLKKEYIKESEACKTEIISEAGNITEETPDIINGTGVKRLFEGDFQRSLNTTEDDIFEGNYWNSSYLCDSYFDPSSSATNTNINRNKVASVKNRSANHEEENTNNCSTPLLREVNNEFTVSKEEISEETNDTDKSLIIREEHKSVPFKTEDEEKLKYRTVNADIPIKECFVNLERLPVSLSVLMNKSSFNINELRNFIPQDSVEHITNKLQSVRETNKTVERNLIKNKRAHTDEESFRCKICNFIATTKLSLLEHTGKHKGNKGYCCNVCDYRTDCQQNVVKHMSKHTGNESFRYKPFCCDICGHRVRTKGNLVRHKIIHTGEKPFACDVCQYSTAYKSYLIIHMRNHTGEKPFRCDVCEFSAVQGSHLKQHMRSHTGEKPFRCDDCDYRAAYKSSLTAHRLTHTGEKQFHCNICGYSSATKGTLVQHMRAHTGEKPFRCSTCGQSTATKSKLIIHMRIHTGEKPFHCKICDFCTARKTSLLGHMRSHSGEKPFLCNVCDFSTAQKANLTDHMRTHTGEKPFHCNVCNFRTVYKRVLIVHLRTHTGEKPFHCNACDYKATRKGFLITHMRKHAVKKLL